MIKSFWKHFLDKPHSYLGVWTFFYANSDDDGVFTIPYAYVLSRFKITRTTLQRMVDFGAEWAESGQKVGRKWAGKELTIIFPTQFSGQEVGRKWAGNGQKKEAKKVVEAIVVPIGLEEPQSPRGNAKSKSSKLYPLMVEAYDGFCKSKTEMGAKMDAHQGKAMKSIIAYLANQIKNKRGITPEEELNTDILGAWNYVLGNWFKISGFYAEQIKLSQIDSNLPNILIQLKNNNQKGRDEKFATREQQVGGISFD